MAEAEEADEPKKIKLRKTGAESELQQFRIWQAQEKELRERRLLNQMLKAEEAQICAEQNLS